jgi:hypothetical protein
MLARLTNKMQWKNNEDNVGGELFSVRRVRKKLCSLVKQRSWLYLVLLIGLAGAGGPEYLAFPAADIAPDATPQIKSIQPSEGAPGAEVTVVIDGENFAKGVYVSFSNPGVHATSTHRVSATKLEAKVQVGKAAQPGPLTLYVSNPASAAVEGTFTVSGGPAPSSTTPEGDKSAEAGAPVVTSVDPPRVTPGSEVNLKIKGKNFVPGAKVSFSNSGVHVTGTDFHRSTELVCHLQVTSEAPTGRTSLFVVNPGDQETEVPFEVGEGNSSKSTASTSAKTSSKSSGPAQRFEVFNLGQAINVFQDPSKAKGVLSISKGKIQYQEGDKEVFSAGLSDVKEVAMNTILGVNTGTFHIILNSGKAYNFIAATLQSSDSQSIVEALRRVIP